MVTFVLMLWAQYTKEFYYNWKLAAPVMLGMLGHTFVGFMDNVMVGQLGTAELAAVSLGNSFLFLAMSLGIGFSTAITPLVAEADSANNFKRGKSAFKHGLVLSTLLGLSLFLLILVFKPLMSHMDQPVEVVVLARPYLDFVALSLVPLMVFQAFKQMSDGLSLTRYPMYATLIANVVNVVFNYLLIFGKFGFPKMGIVGAAYGTLISRVVMVFLIWYLLYRSHSAKAFVTHIKVFVWERLMLLKLFKLGSPSALQMFFEVAIFTAAIWLSGLIGKNAQAANQIALNMASMTFMVAMGLSVTSMIRVGNQVGLKNFVDLRRIAISIFIMALLFASFFGLMFLLLNNELPRLYLNMKPSANLTDNIEVVTIASKLLILAGIFQLSDSLQVVVLGALRGLQDVFIPTVITLIAYWMIGFPICWFLGKAEVLGAVGIWVGLLAGLFSAALLLLIRFNVLTNRMIGAAKRTT